MKILVVGSGGREHALVWKAAQSPRVKYLYAIPGNPGIAQFAECISIRADDIDSIVSFASRERIDLTIVGPEVPLSKGICDRFQEKGLRIFGPTQRAARIESSKIFSKSLMVKYHIPTAKSESFTTLNAARKFIKESQKPLVIKADGLAAGKGVIIAQTDGEAFEALDSFMNKKNLGEAGESVLIEEFLEGEELSYLVITDGKTVLPLSAAQDYKKIYDGEKGPNTGGMGAYSPVPLVMNDSLENVILNEIMVPMVRALEKEGSPFSGFLYGGLILTKKGIKVLEFNARLGDPETQAILPRLESDLIEVLDAALDHRLNQIRLRWSRKSVVCVVLASEGYPGPFRSEVPIKGLERLELMKDRCFVFHAGTELKNGDLVTSGGRVLGVTAWGHSLREAREFVYEGTSKIHFQGMQYRKDIGLKD
ncbi:MAG: phosphoribosylamine--glycine ligase [Nitrospiria bacterium]